jgi:hypothetical protein
MSLKYFSISTSDVNPILDDLLTHSTNGSLKVRFDAYIYDETLQPPFLIHKRINSLLLTNFTTPPIVIPTDDANNNSSPRCFEFVRLYFCPLLADLSIFRLVQCLELDHCSGVTDIYPIRNIPYLYLSRCDNVRNLSCLGLLG